MVVFVLTFLLALALTSVSVLLDLCGKLEINKHVFEHIIFRGTNCSMQTSACTSHQCQNDGICIPTQGGQYTCNCNAEYSGEFCEIEGEVI